MNVRTCRLESASFSLWLGGTGQLRSDLIDGIGCFVSRGHDRVVGIVVRQRRPAAVDVVESDNTGRGKASRSLPSAGA
jgi:hypothetical protein